MLKKLLTLLFIMFAVLLQAYGQTQTISGVITSSSDGLGIIGANIKIKGRNAGTITNIDGEYTLDVNQDDVLEITYIGYKKTEIPVKGRSNFNVVLEEDALQLNEIVSVGYRSEKRADLTGAVSVVQVDDMMSMAENNPIKALQGRIAGMVITSDGSPSGTANIQIRGAGTFNTSSTPLFVIDGVPTQGGMHELNSNDIESIQVLKDASSASIYGSRAANGVIVITTKKGKKNQPRITFDTYVSRNSYENSMEVLNTEEYGRAMWQATINSNEDPNKNNIGYVYDWGYDDNGIPVLYNMKLPYYIDPEKTMRTSDTDWFDEITQTGILQSYNLSASNGTEHGSYFLSMGYLNNEGIIKHTDFERFSTRLNSDFKFFDEIITIGENLTVNKTSEVQAPGGVIDQALKSLPLIPVHTVDGGWGGPTKGMQDRHNPARVLYDNRNNEYSFWRIFGNAYLNIQPIKGLNLKSSFGIDYNNFYKRTMTPSYHTGIISTDENSITMDQSHILKWTFSNTASYTKIIAEKHKIDALVGVEMIREENKNFQGMKKDFLIETPEQMWPSMGVGEASLTGIPDSHSLLSYFGNVGYIYDERYLSSFTLRRDASSRFGKNNQYAIFPAFSLGWRISQERFMEPARNVVSDLKLRGSWGQTGNQEIANYSIYTLYQTDYGYGDPTWGGLSGTAYDFYGEGTGQMASGYKRIQRGNPDLKWETTSQANLGLDYGFFNQKIYGSLEVYLKETKDILIKPEYLGVIGEGGYKWYNGASMENKGLEFSIGYRENFNFGLTCDISGNIAFNRNEVTKLPEEVENMYGGNMKGDNILGRPYGSIYGYVADGLFKTQDEVDNHVDQEGKGIGRIRYKNLNGDDKIDEDDRTWIGVNRPDFTYGININLTYKNFDLSAFFQGVYGIDLNTYDVKSQTDFWSINDIRSNKGTRLLDAWSIYNQGSDIPALQNTNGNEENRLSTYFIENGSYLKLRNLQLGYTLPKKISEKIYLQKLRVYASAQNLWTIKSKSFTGIDPENAAFGYPIPLTITIGLNVTL